MTEFFGSLSIIFSILGYVPYIMSVIRRETKPTLSSWISWLATDGTILGGMYAAGNIAPQMLAYVIGCILVIAVSLIMGARFAWQKVDIICLAIVGAALVVWKFSGSPEIAIVSGVLATVIGSIPMLIYLWKEPGREAPLPWILYGLGSLCGILAITSWTLAGAFTQVSFFVLQSVIVALTLRRH